MKAAEDYIEAAVAEIRRHGVTAWEIDRGHNHPKLRFEWQSKEITYILPGTPSDRRGILNSITDLRRVMGVKRLIKHSLSPAKRTSRTIVTLSAMPSLTVKANPLLALAVVQDNIVMMLQQIRADGRTAFQCGQSGIAPIGSPPHIAKAFYKGWWDGVWGR